MNTLIILLRKEFLQELRAKEVGVVVFSLALLVSVLSAIGVQLAFLNIEQVQRIAPLLIWINFLFSATSGLGKSFDFEVQNGAIDNLKLVGVPFPLVYLAKVLVNAGLLFLTHIAATVALLMLIDLPFSLFSQAFILLSVLVVFAYTALAVLFSAIAATSRMKGVLLPLILLPLLFPLFFAALEVTGELLSTGVAEIGSFWFSFSGLLALIYFLLGLNLYQFAIEE